jgi:adenine-specific DNA-methyltransferase
MPVNQSLALSRRLRRDSTDAERRLWSRLRDRCLGGLKFRRQFPVDRYILDFYCHESRLGVELDGGQHFTDEGLARDGERSRVLGAAGIRVVRSTDSEVLKQIDDVVAAILQATETKASLIPALCHREKESDHGDANRVLTQTLPHREREKETLCGVGDAPAAGTFPLPQGEG